MELHVEYKLGEVTVRTPSATGSYTTIEDAIAGIRILLESAEEEELYPASKYPTWAHRDAEKLARAIEARLAANAFAVDPELKV